MTPLFGLVDCNNFYASCERLFEPHLNGRPIVVLSNNDGCVIARSQEAKAMGIPMGEPYFKVRSLEREGLVVRSSNYALYGDMSQRVISVLSDFVPDIEIYSIDECFLNLNGFTHLDLPNYALDIHKTLFKWTGIPVSIGIGPTKTLCKLACRMAKKNDSLSPVGVILNRADLHYGLATTPIGEVWGIGRRWARKLKADGFHFAIDLATAPDRWIRQKMGVVGLRTAMELRGIACIEVEDTPADKKSICVSRSFGNMLTNQTDMEEAIKTFTMRACEKLRRHGLLARHASVFIRTNAHRTELPQYKPSLTLTLPYPSNDTRLIMNTLLLALRRLYRDGYHYKQAGVLLLELSRPKEVTRSFFGQDVSSSVQLMKAIDQLNQRYGEGSVNIGQCKKARNWYATRNHASPRYTTSWKDLRRISST